MSKDGDVLKFQIEINIPALSWPTQDTLERQLPLPLGISLECSASGPSNRSILEASSEGTRRQDQLWFPRSCNGGEYSSSQGKSKLHSRPAMTANDQWSKLSPKCDFLAPFHHSRKLAFASSKPSPYPGMVNYQLHRCKGN